MYYLFRHTKYYTLLRSKKLEKKLVQIALLKLSQSKIYLNQLLRLNNFLIRRLECFLRENVCFGTFWMKVFKGKKIVLKSVLVLSQKRQTFKKNNSNLRNEKKTGTLYMIIFFETWLPQPWIFGLAKERKKVLWRI